MGQGSLVWALGIRYILQSNFTREPCLRVLGPSPTNSKVIMYPFIFVPCTYCFLSLKRQKKLLGKGRIQVFLPFPLYFSPLWYLSLYNCIFLCTYILYITVSYVLYFGYFGLSPIPSVVP